jgi:two-component system alkaline phosphatase synthesis response regulator PhoP
MSQSDSVKICVIEDDISIQQMYRYRLEREGFEVRTADNGLLGLELVRSFQPDIILLDIRMPIMTGDEMLRKMRSEEWGSSIKVIILTNISKTEAPSHLRLLSVNRYIVKAHTTPSQVTEIINEVLG